MPAPKRFPLRTHHQVVRACTFRPSRAQPEPLNTRVFGTPQWVRTTDLWLRRPTLYPAELVARIRHVTDLIGFSPLCNLLIQSQIQSFFQKIESNRDGVLRTIQSAWQHVAVKFRDSDRRMTQYLG